MSGVKPCLSLAAVEAVIGIKSPFVDGALGIGSDLSTGPGFIHIRKHPYLVPPVDREIEFQCPFGDGEIGLILHGGFVNEIGSRRGRFLDKGDIAPPGVLPIDGKTLV